MTEQNLEYLNEGHNPRPGIIRPCEINNFIGTFGVAEVERAAERLVEFFQPSNRWHSFGYEDVFAYYRLRGWQRDFNSAFHGLMGSFIHISGLESYPCTPQKQYVVSVHGKYLAVTTDFVTCCAKHVKLRSPA